MGCRVRYRELTRRLRALDCEFDRQAKGDHEIWINITTHARTTIPNWGSRDLRPGTISAILRDLGISRSEFENR
ncbi:MAG: type II toxin-antitoxin system HicA family toxin [Chloroflexi bacterium]|nr:type II toxin-antitoxin system HicA family toxin [Chloroflexota bacterium]